MSYIYYLGKLFVIYIVLLTLVAQSRAVPRPKLFPATTTNDIRSSLYLVEASNMVVTTPDGWWVVYGPDLVWFFIRFFSLVCEKVPRDMTSLKVKNKLKILLMILLFCKPQISVGYSGRYFANFEFCEMRNQISDLLRNLRNCEIAIFEKSSCLNRLFLCVIACSPHLANRLAIFGGLQSTRADFLVAHCSKIELSVEKLVKIGNHWPKIGQK